MKQLKLNTLLAKTDHLASSFKALINDYISFFKSKQGAFKGLKKTYTPNPGTIDIPTLRANELVVTTVEEKFNYFEETAAPYIDALFSQEKTNSSGKAKAELIVDGTSWGEFTSLELLRLKTLLESNNLPYVYENIPVRDDKTVWKKTTDTEYSSRPTIFETEKLSFTQKTTEKEDYILADPNVENLPASAKYEPKIGHKTTVVELGNGTVQNFSGELSHYERAQILKRRSTLVTAVVEALKVANEVEVEPSTLTSEKIFGYLHRGV